MNLLHGVTELLKLLRERRWLALGVFTLVLGLGGIISYLLPKEYTSTMRILVRPTPTDLRSTPDRAESTRIGGVSEEEVNSEAELLTNYDLIRQAVIQNGLAASERGDDVTQRIDTAVRRLAKGVSVNAIRRANIIDVQYSAKSPQRAANVLRSIESGYLQAHLKAQSTPGGFAFFQNEMQYYRDQLMSRQVGFAEFSAKEGAVNLDQQLMLLTKMVADQDASLQQTQTQAATLREEIQRSALVQQATTGRINTTRKSVPYLATIDHLTTLLADLQDRRIQQTAKFRDGDVVVQETDREIASVRKQLLNVTTQSSFEESSDINPIVQNLQAGVASRRVELSGLEAKTTQLSAQLVTNRSAVNHLLAVSGRYHLLSNDVQNAQDDYNNYVQRQESARISESLDRSRISNIVIAQEPTESVLPVSSHRLLVVVFSFFLALFASVGACMLARTPQSKRELQAV